MEEIILIDAVYSEFSPSWFLPLYIGETHAFATGFIINFWSRNSKYSWTSAGNDGSVFGDTYRKSCRLKYFSVHDESGLLLRYFIHAYYTPEKHYDIIEFDVILNKAFRITGEQSVSRREDFFAQSFGKSA